MKAWQIVKTLALLMAGSLTAMGTAGNGAALAQATPTPTPQAAPRKVETSGQRVVRRVLQIEVSPESKIRDIARRERYKEVDAWARIGARPDDGTAPETTPAWYFTPFKWGWNAYQNTQEWLGDEGSRFRAGIEPHSGASLHNFWEGAANYSVTYQKSTGEPIYDPAKYDWSVQPQERPLYIASDSTAAQRQIRSLEPSTPNKELHFDFGPVDPQSVTQRFPLSTTVTAFVGKEDGSESSRSAEAKINWYIRPVTFHHLSVKFDLFKDGAPEDIAQSIYEISQDNAQVIRTGAQLVENAANAIYFDPAKNLLYGPFIAGGIHSIGSLYGQASRLGREVATGVRAAHVAAVGRDTTAIRYIVTLERAENAGTVLRGMAQTDAAATATQAGETIAQTSTAVDRAYDALDAADGTIAKAGTLKQALQDSGKVEEAAQVEQNMQKMEAVRDDARRAIDFAETKQAEAVTASEGFATTGDDIANAAEDANFGQRLDDVSGMARGVSEASRAANHGAFGVVDSVDEISRLGDETAEIGRAAGLTDHANDLAAASTNARATVESAVAAAQESRSTAINLYERNATTLTDTAYVFPEPQCFVAGTPIVMADGTLKPIERVKAGEKVASCYQGSRNTSAKTVVRTFQHRQNGTLIIHLANGEIIETTAGHPFYVENSGFVIAGDLGIGTSIVTRAGPSLKILSIEHKAEVVTVYNFEVEGAHTYFVGTSGLWVHNWCFTDQVPHDPEALNWDINPDTGKAESRPVQINDPQNPAKTITDFDKVVQDGEVIEVLEMKAATWAQDPKSWASDMVTGKLDKYKKALLEGATCLHTCDFLLRRWPRNCWKARLSSALSGDRDREIPTCTMSTSRP